MVDTSDRLVGSRKVFDGYVAPSIPNEFKRDAVGLLASSAQPLRRIARELGIVPSRLRAWWNKGDAGQSPRRPNMEREI
jgi:transposase-like protein